MVPLLISNALFGLLALWILLLQPGWLNQLGFGGLHLDLALAPSQVHEPLVA
jgi:hypothetical protein